MAWRLTSGLRCLAHEGLPAHPASPDRHDRDAVWPRSGLFSVNYFCRLASVIFAGSGRRGSRSTTMMPARFPDHLGVHEVDRRRARGNRGPGDRPRGVADGGAFAVDGNVPLCHVRAVRSLIPAAAAAAVSVFPAIRFSRNRQTCASVINPSSPRKTGSVTRLAGAPATGRSPPRRPAKIIVVDHRPPSSPRSPVHAGGNADRRISSHVGGRTRWSDSGPDASHRHHPWQSAWLLGARWQVRSRRRDRAPWAGGGPDVGRGGCPETDANRGIIGP